MSYQWFPGHMTKSMRMMQENLKLIDMIIELSDARIPRSSTNPELKNLANGKSHILILTKSDLADPVMNTAWADHYASLGSTVLFADARENKTVKALKPRLMEACQEKIERNRRRGIVGRPIRAMVVGVPNVGKSTFINSFVGKATAKTGNRPGVTRGKQWIRLNKELELLDTPGVLWPKIEDDRIGENLALTGSIRDEIMDAEALACLLIARLTTRYPGVLTARYGIEEAGEYYTILEKTALRLGCLKAGGETDLTKAAQIMIRDFRAGTLGRITLEGPDD